MVRCFFFLSFASESMHARWTFDMNRVVFLFSVSFLRSLFLATVQWSKQMNYSFARLHSHTISVVLSVHSLRVFIVCKVKWLVDYLIALMLLGLGLLLCCCDATSPSSISDNETAQIRDEWRVQSCVYFDFVSLRVATVAVLRNTKSLTQFSFRLNQEVSQINKQHWNTHYLCALRHRFYATCVPHWLSVSKRVQTAVSKTKCGTQILVWNVYFFFKNK